MKNIPKGCFVEDVSTLDVEEFYNCFKVLESYYYYPDLFKNEYDVSQIEIEVLRQAYYRFYKEYFKRKVKTLIEGYNTNYYINNENVSSFMLKKHMRDFILDFTFLKTHQNIIESINDNLNSLKVFLENIQKQFNDGLNLDDATKENGGDLGTVTWTESMDEN